MAVWGLGYFAWQISTSPNVALFWCRVLMAGAIFTPFFYLHHLNVALLHSYKKHELLKRIIRIGYLLALVFLVWDFTPYFVASVEAKSIFKYWPTPGVLFAPFLTIWSLYALYTLFLLFDFYRHETDQDLRARTRLIMVGSILAWFGSGFNNYPLWYGVNILPWGNALMTVYIVMVGYAIFKYNWLDIEVIIKKTLVFTGLLASTFAILILPTLLIQEYILRSASITARMTGLAISGLIIILTMRRIENFLINITDKYLFQKKYDYKELLKTFTSEVLTVLNLDNLVNLTVNKLVDTVKINSCAVMLFDNDKQQFDVEASSNLKDSSVVLSKSEEMAEYLEHTRGYLLKKELAERKIYVPPKVDEIIDKLNAELIIPMILQDKMIGILSLGKKKSDEDYAQDDLDILLPLARTLAIAISNAELFDELGKTQAEAAQKEKMAVIGTLSAGINHEICNPLGIARGQCEAFLLNTKDGLYKSKTPQELLRKAEEIMAKVIKETDRATAITKKLSSFAKPAKGEKELVDISKEVDEVHGLVGYELKLEKVEVIKDIAAGIPRILVDKKQFQEVLFNLIRNAGQAIGEKGKITVSAREYDGKVVIDVQDTGSGIPENKIKELFNPFFTTKEPGKGTGLGLFIVRQVVEKNGGRIYLKRTKVGEGTTFTLEFPVAQVPAEAVMA